MGESDRSLVRSIDIEGPLGEIERINAGVDFLSAALPEYPHDAGHAELATILHCLSTCSQKALREIEKMCGLQCPIKTEEEEGMPK
jgi:hypothetical protein